jgi:hypothetical protein
MCINGKNADNASIAGICQEQCVRQSCLTNGRRVQKKGRGEMKIEG